jgi:aryl sulfotransferase
MSITIDPPRQRYRNFLFDSARWDGFEFRPGDIIISTPPKCGTTWTQMICGLLIFQTPDFDRPLAEITPWLDMNTRDLDGVFADLDTQKHRRFIKTHTPIDGLPQSDEVVYVCVGRDPRDVGISMDNHMLNVNLEQLIALRAEAVGLDDLAEFFPDGVPERPEAFVDRFWAWVDDDTLPPAATSSLLSTLNQMDVAWRQRDRDNVIIKHYADYKNDLEGEMRDLARQLEIEVPESLWPELVHAAGFEYMQEHADRVAPNATQDLWLSAKDFFRSGENGQWRDFLDEEGTRRYEARVAALATPELAKWAHRGD